MAYQKLKILDFYVHQGNQYEFFKTGHDFYLCGKDGELPDWNINHRPLASNVTLANKDIIRDINFDVVIVRSPIHNSLYKDFLKKGSNFVATVQTTDPFAIPTYSRAIVWNCFTSMKKYRCLFKTQQNFYVPHGFDPNEFQHLNIERNNRQLAVGNVFQQRDHFLNYELCKDINKKINTVDILGHGNEDLPNSIGEANSLEDLVLKYNSYGIFLNTTRHSAMPRSRGEAMMCGMPIITTNNYDALMYFEHKRNAIVPLTTDHTEWIDWINKLNESKDLREQISGKARETAIEKFHIKHYCEKWNSILGKL
jgi:glycosyltransferase involved in cell wall biosynthesis